MLSSREEKITQRSMLRKLRGILEAKVTKVLWFFLTRKNRSFCIVGIKTTFFAQKAKLTVK